MSGQNITLSTKPYLCGRSGHRQGSGGSLSHEKFECVSHRGDFALLNPGESVRWAEQERFHNWGDDNRRWLQFRLIFQRSSSDGKGWRGIVYTPWVSAKKELADGK
jgi:hypothetical protein